MENITFRMNPSFCECLKAQFVGSWLYRRPRVSLVVTFVFFLFAAIMITEFPRYWYVFVAMISFLLGMWSYFVYNLFQSAVIARKLHKMSEESLIHYLDEEKGFGIKDKDSHGWIGWNEFLLFKEMTNFFFLQYKSGGMVVIYKSSLEQEKISSVRKMLQNTPVQEKYLYADK